MQALRTQDEGQWVTQNICNKVHKLEVRLQRETSIELQSTHGGFEKQLVGWRVDRDAARDVSRRDIGGLAGRDVGRTVGWMSGQQRRQQEH